MESNKPTVQLTGHDGNVFNIMGRCARVLPKDKSKEFLDRCKKSSSYDEVLRFAMEYCDVE